MRSVLTLAEFIRDIYVPHIQLHRRNFQSTLSFIKCHVLPRFGVHLDAITTDMVTEAHLDLRAKGYALAQANKLPILLKVMFNLAKKNGLPGSQCNPANGVSLFTPNNAKERYLSSAETQRLHEALSRSDNTQLKSIVTLLLLFGCHASVSCWMPSGEHFDLERRNWRIPTVQEWQGSQHPYLCKALEVLKGLRRAGRGVFM